MTTTKEKQKPMNENDENQEYLTDTVSVKTNPDNSLTDTMSVKTHQAIGRSLKDAGLLVTNQDHNLLAMPPKCLTVKGTRKFQELLTLDLISTHSFNFQKGSFLRQLSNIRT
jgi:hypothetical protein